MSEQTSPLRRGRDVSPELRHIFLPFFRVAGLLGLVSWIILAWAGLLFLWIQGVGLIGALANDHAFALIPIYLWSWLMTLVLLFVTYAIWQGYRQDQRRVLYFWVRTSEEDFFQDVGNDVRRILEGHE